MFHYKKRSNESEIMDDLEMEGDELASTLKQLARVNRWLGGSSVALQGIKSLLKLQGDNPKTLKIVDIGCGGGEILKLIADWARKNGIKTELIGLDANAFTVEYAKKYCSDYPEISFRQLNVFSEEFAALEYDIALCSLFLHHFTEAEIVKILKTLNNSAAIGIVINDLERSKLAYLLFDIVTRILGASKMICSDGKLSIRRAFTKRELVKLFEDATINKPKITWKWAFRYEVLALK
jgi:2-polyprenyl-3-methyl-5-hydroxy-6-metoxy-1,4-benzoquinol methylase